MIRNELSVFLLRKRVTLTLGAALLLPICTAVGDAQAPGRANAWTTPHVLTIADGGDVTTLNPHLSTFGDYSATYGCDAFPPAGQNDLRWCNKTAQDAMDALLEHYDQSQRIADLKVTMREFAQDVPSIITFMRVDLFAFNKDLKDYHPNNITPFDNMMNVDI